MKRGNKGVSYQDIMSESNQAITDATEQQRKANVEEQKVNNDNDGDFNENAPGKYMGKLIDVGVDILKQDAAKFERAHNKKISAASIQRR